MGVDAEGFWVEMGLLPELLGVRSVIACVEDPPPAAAAASSTTASSTTALTTTAGAVAAKPALLLHMRRCPDTEPEAPAHVHLLLRRGHYDLLYPRSEQWAAGEELVTGAKAENTSHSSSSSSAKGSPSTSTKAAASGGGSSGSRSSSAVNGRSSSSSSSSEQRNGHGGGSSSSHSSQRARAEQSSRHAAAAAAAAGAYGSSTSNSSSTSSAAEQGWRLSSRQLAHYQFEAPVVTHPRGFASAAELEQQQLNSSSSSSISSSSNGVYAAGYEGVGGWAGSGVRGLLRAGCELDVAGARRAANQQYAWLQHEGRMWQQVLLSPG
jgi:hypothetical protein